MKVETDIDKRRAEYRATAELLARLRTQEAAALTEEDARRIIRSLVAFEIPWKERPDWSGLAEQQAKFSRWRTK